MPTFSGLVEHPAPSPYPFGPDSLARILDAGLADYPDRLALVDGDRTWTWSELDAAVADVAGGIAPEQVLWWSLENCAEMVIGALATFRAGALWVGLREVRARTVLPWVSERLGDVTLIDSHDLIPTGDRIPPAIDATAAAVITFTSGTSGVAKAVVHSQRNLLWPGLISAELEPPIPDERIGTPLSLTIANMLALGPLSALLRGSTYVVMNRTFAEGFAADVFQFDITRCFVVPTILHDLVNDEHAAPVQLQSLDRVIVGGAGADPELLRSFHTLFGVRPTLSYGLSEAPTGVVRESLDDPIGSGRGFPLPHVQVEIVGDDGEIAATGTPGEVCLRSATTGSWAHTWTPTLGYVGQPELTSLLFREGRLHTGDIGSLDADGALSITGRLSNLIIRGGKNIDPIRIEATLLEDAAIAECVVVGLPDHRLGEIVAALVVPASAAFDGDAAVARVRHWLGAEGVIDRWAVAPGLPRNDMGKVIRNLPMEAFLTSDGPAITYLTNGSDTLEG